MPPLPADSIHARACKLKCEKILTRPKRTQPFEKLHFCDIITLTGLVQLKFYAVFKKI